ncbi:MAG TPA: TIGR01777 family oxidoreductase [Gaiellaceae bacterium]|nr:TIGR01777 family oxidoreductase [Gaiellaceae bacterium]
MKIVISGASGLIGSALVPALTATGHDVIRLVRRDARTADEVEWDPATGTIDRESLHGVDAFVNLSGANLDVRWTAAAKREVLQSRTQTTHLLATVAAELEPRAATLVCAGGTGVYGDRGDELLTEESDAAAGVGFLAEVMRQTEAASQAAREAGVRVVHFRQGIVLSRDGGALRRMLPFFRLGAGGPVGSGKQWWSWVSLADVVSSYRLVLESDLAGPINLTAPNPVTSRQFAKALGKAINRPAVLPAPSFGIKLLFGQKGEEVLLFGQRVLPARLLDSGFEFSAPTLDVALERALAD